MKIMYIGCVKSSYILLEELLLQKKEICGVITKNKSSFNADFQDLSPLCVKYDIDFEYTSDINSPAVLDFIKKKNPDIIYCFGWSWLIKKEVLDMPPLGVVGYHPAKLPLNKGRHPIIWALVLGLSETASTFFMMDEHIDNGEIISQYPIEIDIKDNANTLYDKIISVAKHQVIKFTEQFEKNEIEVVKINELGDNIWRKRNKEDGKIDFRMSALNIYNLVRGLTTPYVGAHFVFNGKDYKTWHCEIVKDSEKKYKNIEFGKVLEVYSPTSFLVRSGDDLIKVTDCDKCNLRIGDYL